MNKSYVIPTAQDFKRTGERLLKDYEQNINIVRKELDIELYSFPNIEIDNYITKCAKARQKVFDTTLKTCNALQWLTKQYGFKKALSDTLNKYLTEITKEQVTKLFIQDIQHYYTLLQNKSDTALDMNIYQLQQKYQEKNLAFDPYQENFSSHGDYANFSNHFQDKKLFNFLSSLCVFYGDWLDGLYKEKIKYIKDLENLQKSLVKIHKIIDQPSFISFFPKDLVSNLLPVVDLEQDNIKENSIEYLDNLIKHFDKIGLQDNGYYLERRLKCADLVTIIIEYFQSRQQSLMEIKDLISITYDLINLPIDDRLKSGVIMDKKSIRDLISFKNLNIVLNQDVEYISLNFESDEGYCNYMKNYVEEYDSHEDYIRNNPEED